VKNLSIDKWIFNIIFFFLVSASVTATTFIPTTLDKQVLSASAGAVVSLLKFKSFKGNGGYVQTEYTFKVHQGMNLSSEELDHGTLSITLPGGSFEGVSTVVDGGPEFITGEKIFLLLKRVNNKIYLSNFTVGKFSIKKIEGSEYFVNDVFPNMPNVGIIKKEQMLDLMKSQWRELNIETILSNQKKVKTVWQSSTPSKIPPKFEKRKERKPAAQEDGYDVGKFVVYFLSLIGIVFSLLLLKSRKNEK
jgi:hypothetical protein